MSKSIPPFKIAEAKTSEAFNTAWQKEVSLREAFRDIDSNFNAGSPPRIRAMHDAGLTHGQAKAILLAAAKEFRPGEDRGPDIERDLQRHWGTPRPVEKGGGSVRKAKDNSKKGKPAPWPGVDDELALKFKDEDRGWLNVPPEGQDTLDVLHDLYSSGAEGPDSDMLLCIGTSQDDPVTKSYREIERAAKILSKFQYIVPHPMTQREGLTEAGSPSQRAKESVGPRRFMVVEIDSLSKKSGKAPIPESAQLGTLKYLSGVAPLAMVLRSGGKSLHGWFEVRYADEDQLRKFLSLACFYGADRAAFTLNQLMRIPWGTREENGKVQEVVHWAGSSEERSELPEWDHDTIEMDLAFLHGKFPPLRIFYLSGPGKYLVDTGETFREYGRKGPVKTGLEKWFSGKGLEDSALKDAVNEAFGEIEIARAVDWKGDIAGERRGLFRFHGQRFLIDRGPKVIEPSEGNYPLMESILSQAFPNTTARMVFELWLAGRHVAVREAKHVPSPMMVLAGKPNAGKSLLAFITKEILGGRVANPMTAWRGKLPWTDNLLGCELLLIDDSVGSTDPRARREFGERFKEAIYCGNVEINKRNHSSLTMRPAWAVMVCCNETPDNLSVIPPLDEGIEDKISLLKVMPIVTPMLAATPGEKAAFAAAIKAELPAFLDRILKLETPDELNDSRAGVIAWKDPELLEAISQLSPETQLEELLTMAFERGTLGPGWMSASELKSVLLNSGFRGQAEKLLKYAPNCGKYMSGLLGRGSPIVRGSKKVNGITQYLLSAQTSERDGEVSDGFDEFD